MKQRFKVHVNNPNMEKLNRYYTNGAVTAKDTPHKIYHSPEIE